MFRWVAFVNPPLYLAHYAAASVRHYACGMSYHQHRALMLAWYGV